jgi:hypothetical protein
LNAQSNAGTNAGPGATPVVEAVPVEVASVADVSAEGHLGRKGTENDANVTGGLEAGGGGKLSLGANFGRDTDGDGVPNYGFNIGAKLGVGFNVGVDVERPMEHLKNAGSAVAGWFGF